MCFSRYFIRGILLRKGFTLLEVMVVIGITLVLSGVALSYNRNSEAQLVVYREQSLLIGMLNRAKSLTLEKFKSPDPLYETCGFGLHIEPPRTVILFQDLGAGGCAGGTALEKSARYVFGPSDRPEVIETRELDGRVQIAGLPPTGLDIAFIPPDLIVTSTISIFPIKFDIKTPDGKYTAAVSLSSVGQVTNN